MNTLGLLSYSTHEHEPIHVHGKCQGRENKAELIIEHGKVVEIIISSVRGKRPLRGSELLDFETLVRHYVDEIVQKWIDYFILHQPVQSQRITTRIK